MAFVACDVGFGRSENRDPAHAGSLHPHQPCFRHASSRSGCRCPDRIPVVVASLCLSGSGAEFTPDGCPDPSFDLVVPMAVRGIVCPPRLKQLFRLLVEQLGVKVFPNQLQHSLSQLFIAAEIEDHIQGRLSGQTSSTVWDRGATEPGARTRAVRLRSHYCLI